jgi:acyl-CoA synthetase (AMP-forming)/AMP-acid ligase II
MTAPATIAELFFARAREFADHPFLHAPLAVSTIYDIQEADFTFREALAAVDALTQTYARIGAGASSRVALALDNRPEFFIHFLALNALGASVVPLNSAMQEEELLFQIDHGDCALIVAASAHQERLTGIAARAAQSPAVCGPDEIATAPHLPGDGALRAGDARTREAALLYTSGTTGRPKGCVLSNDYFLAIARHYTALGGHVTFERGCERIITPLPVTHMNALACSFMAAIETGSCLIQLDRFHPKSWWQTVRESGATIMHYLGVMPAMLLTAPNSPEDDFSGRLKFGFGAGCDPRHHAAFEKRFGVPLIEAWAMTETGAGAWITASSEPRHVGARCFGRAPQGLEWRVIGEDGKDAPAGAPGELLVRRAGPEKRRHFFSGYLKDEEATEAAWRGGWFHTGDAVRVDESGHFYFVDRLKNVVRRSGENIAALEVESVLMRSAAVAGCVVVPVPDEIRGDEVMALVVAADGRKEERDARAIFDLAMENLAYFKAPGYLSFIDALPMTASEKVKRGEAKAIARALVAEGAAFNFTALKKPGKN